MSAILGLIPARGGSKGIPRKNLRPLAGKPLIAWTIEVALRCKLLDRVIVSTNDSEIRDVAIQYGAEVPFLRPEELASDTATSIAVATHALDWLAEHGQAEPDFLLQLQPTSPLRTQTDIETAVRIQREENAPAVVSVRPAGHPPQWLRRIGPGGELREWQSGIELSRRQDSKPVYELNGAIYLIKTVVFRAERTFFPGNTLAQVMPPERSLDIDTLWDLHLAELILKDRFASGVTQCEQEDNGKRR
jgi:CMP-N,N'-diacetyllegionaminic acid synthase